MAQRLVIQGPTLEAIEILARQAGVPPAELVLRALRREDEAQEAERHASGTNPIVDRNPRRVPTSYFTNRPESSIPITERMLVPMTAIFYDNVLRISADDDADHETPVAAPDRMDIETLRAIFRRADTEGIIHLDSEPPKRLGGDRPSSFQIHFQSEYDLLLLNRVFDDLVQNFERNASKLLWANTDTDAER
jgi:hypothetical protein